jgi:hypothetical protein
MFKGGRTQRWWRAKNPRAGGWNFPVGVHFTQRLPVRLPLKGDWAILQSGRVSFATIWFSSSNVGLRFLTPESFLAVRAVLALARFCNKGPQWAPNDKKEKIRHPTSPWLPSRVPSRLPIAGRLWCTTRNPPQLAVAYRTFPEARI